MEECGGATEKIWSRNVDGIGHDKVTVIIVFAVDSSAWGTSIKLHDWPAGESDSPSRNSKTNAQPEAPSWFCEDEAGVQQYAIWGRILRGGNPFAQVHHRLRVGAQHRTLVTKDNLRKDQSCEALLCRGELCPKSNGVEAVQVLFEG